MASKKQISNHPNPYVLAEVIKDELKAAKDNRCSAVIGNANKRGARPKVLKQRDQRKITMDNLRDHNIGNYLIKK
jgi:hypothetical protein